MADNDACPVDCSEYEVDILTGIATCPDCGNRWVTSSEELEQVCRQVLGIERRERIAPSQGCCAHGYDVDRGVLCPVCDS